MIKLISIILLLGILSCDKQLINAQIETACIGVPFDEFVNSPKSCAHFYLCRDNEALENSCPDDFYFHPISQYCDFPANVDCTKCSPFGIQHLPIEGSCSRFIRCEHGYTSEQVCEDGKYFNRETGWCDDTITDCEDETTVPPPSTEEFVPDCTRTTQIFHSHSTDCSKYFMCLNGNLIRGQCSNNLIWNQFNLNCDVPAETFCVSLTANHENVNALIVNLFNSIKSNNNPLNLDML